MLASQDSPTFRIPRKSVAVGYQPVMNVSESKDRQSDKLDEERCSTIGQTSRFSSWLLAIKHLLRWLTGLPDRPWLPEATSIGLACITFTAIVITLAMYQGLPLSQWPFFISINSLISVFTAIFKAALVMPVAEGESRCLSRIETDS